MSPFRGVARMMMQRALAQQAQSLQSLNTSSALAGGAQHMAALQAQQAVAAGQQAIQQAWQWPSSMPIATRGIATSRPARQQNLLSILDAEIKHEKEHYTKPEAISSGPPAPFSLTEAPGDTLLTLTRKFNNEDISVDLHVNNQPGAADDVEGEEGEESLSTVVFNVHVTKGDQSLVFECESDGLFLAINHVSHETEGQPVTDSTYTGPVFDELDDTLQQTLREYLAARGITPELGEYLRHLVFDKEVREYQAWLQRVADFVKK